MSTELDRLGPREPRLRERPDRGSGARTTVEWFLLIQQLAKSRGRGSTGAAPYVSPLAITVAWRGVAKIAPRSITSGRRAPEEVPVFIRGGVRALYGGRGRGTTPATATRARYFGSLKLRPRARRTRSDALSEPARIAAGGRPAPVVARVPLEAAISASLASSSLAARNAAWSLRRPRRRPARAGPLPSRRRRGLRRRRRGPGAAPMRARRALRTVRRRRGVPSTNPRFGSATITPGAPPMVMRSPTARSYVGAAAACATSA